MIEVKNLSKFYGSTKAVDNVSLSVRRGELFGLLGPNGSGKTTMIKMLTGQIKPTSGSLRVHGRSFRAYGQGVYESAFRAGKPYRILFKDASGFRETYFCKFPSKRRSVLLYLLHTAFHCGFCVCCSFCPV